MRTLDGIVHRRYVLQGELKGGAMGKIYLAEDVTLGRKVVVKELKLQGYSASARFRREGKITANLTNAYTVRLLDYFEENGAMFHVLEHLDGENLRERLDRGPLTPAEAVLHLTEVCVALAEAHDQGVVHRDLKPANLFLARGAHGNAVIKVLDFGVAKQLRGEKFTIVGLPPGRTALVGTPKYMAPEQIADSTNVDRRADLWSLAVIAHEMLGTYPFRDSSFPELIASICQDEPRRPRDVPHGLAVTLRKALQKDPLERPQSAVEFARELARFGDARARVLLYEFARGAEIDDKRTESIIVSDTRPSEHADALNRRQHRAEELGRARAQRLRRFHLVLLIAAIIVCALLLIAVAVAEGTRFGG